MPHRATYIFPRQFPPNDHERKIENETAFNVESDKKVSKITKPTTTGKKSLITSDLFTGENKYQSGKQQQQLGIRSRSRSRGRGGGSGAFGSLFSGTTIDGNVCSSDAKDTILSSPQEEDEENVHSLVRRARENYYLQLTLAVRLSYQASLAQEPVVLPQSVPERFGVSYDVETVSYRFWVNGCLSYSDKISDGFYNILGMNPYLWLMCNETEEGRRMPSLTSLKEVDPSDASIEVILVDRRGDLHLKELEDKAQELYHASENIVLLVEELGKLVAIYMGGAFQVEQGDLHMHWKFASGRLRDYRRCIVLPIGNFTKGVCRHRAILFKVKCSLTGSIYFVAYCTIYILVFFEHY
ncbi:hypothetical protein IFM89_033968 [Coptis chinensis]|uniref:EDR1/CTR1/ARMC3-like peptidase-like domain-containing protein n=1 Tax=Coptis chinensis TaxID=261450 RepID=A0A835HRU9_9MAGN|nr:hypothetical protein IFM89_033968 [Coptis chinensis]